MSACLRGSALLWHSTELSEIEKELLRTASVQQWTIILIKRFKERTTTAVQKLQAEKYTMADARAGKSPRAWVTSMLRYAKAAEFTSVHNQLTVIWNNLALDFKRDIPELTP